MLNTMISPHVIITKCLFLLCFSFLFWRSSTRQNDFWKFLKLPDFLLLWFLPFLWKIFFSNAKYIKNSVSSLISQIMKTGIYFFLLNNISWSFSISAQSASCFLYIPPVSFIVLLFSIVFSSSTVCGLWVL